MNTHDTKKKWPCALVLGGMALAVLGLVAAIGLPWWLQLREYNQAIERSVERIARYQRILQARPLFEERRKVLQAELDKFHYFIKAANPELAAANLQNKVKKIVSASGGALMSTQYLGENKDDPRLIQIKVRMKGDVGALSSVLFKLERSKPVLKLDQLSVRARQTTKGRGVNRVEGYNLDASFVVSGYLAEVEK